MIGLQARGKPPCEAQSVFRKRVTTRILRGHRVDQILETHDFRDCRGHFGSRTGPERCQDLAGSVFAEQPVAKIANCKMADGSERGGIMLVRDEPRNLIRFIGNHGLNEEGL